MNAYLWSIINDAGWWWWAPCIIIATKNLIILANLGAPATTLGRWARVFAWLAHLPWPFVGVVAMVSQIIGIPASFNALGPISVPLMLVANNMLYLQVYLACRDKKHESPNPAYGARKLLRSMVEPKG